MSGAYRCPVCGIDFPSGTPGAPDVTEPGDDKARYTEPPREDIVDAEFELDEETVDDALHVAPGEERGRSFEAWGTPEGGATARGADLNVRPREATLKGASGASTLSVRPARESVAVTVSDIDDDEGPSRPRRSMARKLGGTLFSAILLFGIVAGVGWWLNDRGMFSAPGAGPAADAVVVEAEDGWVDLPTGDGALVVEADGPFRLRVSGKVYSLSGDRPVQVPARVAAAVRIVRGPASATVRPR